ncbi:MAG: ribulose-phosphate 3-epimerase [Coriobacteriales bacterium]|jgi:ribulose-phosphate 3-epimerase
MGILMAPSILSADFMNLERDVRNISVHGADLIHFDVMDGHFVPNLTLGVPFVKAMKKITDTPLDVHLMIDNPADQIDWYLDAGADIATVHVEAFGSPRECRDLLHHIREREVRSGIAISPDTPVSELYDVLDLADVLLVMSVHPGFGGQSFIESTPDKISEIVEFCSQEGLSPLIEVDGGINAKTAPLVTERGATALVAGNAVFGQPDHVVAMEAIRAAGEAGAR